MTLSSRVALPLAAAFLATGLLLPAAARAADAPKGPPACAAINFRPVPSGQSDGVQDAGLYTSRFGKIELKATVKGGEPEDYFVEFNKKKMQPLSGAIPKNIANCLGSKKVPVPTKADNGACTGTRFRLVIDRTGSPKIAVLYGLRGGSWQPCTVGTVDV
jgi:hypothetical protein